jgi:hypothetical protein
MCEAHRVEERALARDLSPFPIVGIDEAGTGRLGDEEENLDALMLRSC